MAGYEERVAPRHPPAFAAHLAAAADTYCMRCHNGGRVRHTSQSILGTIVKVHENRVVYFACAIVLLPLAVVTSALSWYFYFFPIHRTPYDIAFKKWAAVCDAPHCAEAAREMFDMDGAIGDAAVAALLCMGVTAPHLTGIGGGLMAVFYNNSTMKVEALDALGVSPRSVTPDMFSANASALKLGASAAIVPGALAGMKALHTKVGKLPWEDVFQPAIRLAREGFTIGSHLADALANNENVLNVSPALRKRFSNSETGALLRSGEKLVQTRLAELLTKLSEKGPEYLYKQELADEIDTNIKNAGGSLTKSDLSEYQPVWQNPLSSKMGSHWHIHSAPIPGAGVVLAIVAHSINMKFAEALKFALAKRPELGDTKEMKERQVDMVKEGIRFAQEYYDEEKPLTSANDYGIKYAPHEDLGGAQLTIVAPTGDAVSVTSGLNGMFGSGFQTTSGLLLNNYMNAFAKSGKQFNLDPSPANQLGPGKRPMTSMVPTIITKSATPSALVGAFGGSGGLPAISAVAKLISCLEEYSLIRCVWNDTRLQPTFRSTTPNSVFAEHKTEDFDPASLLRSLGNNVTEKTILAAATGIILAKSDLLFAPNDTKRVDGGRSGE
ncbi:scoloptoxin SSD14-like [Dermacentor silvarum]|uniref:scoloptoxin SSD14-like n=1 Tax=Dermacentor silvarum TaxID=543639 RepID=UPI002101AD64|nr:scoloptoxin SSD14-like [Dermacentor silvarum]